MTPAFKLSFLDPEPLSWTSEKEHRYVESIAEATGVLFLCPKCWLKNWGPVGTHGIICWAPSVPKHAVPGPGRWNLVGELENLTLVAGSSSVLLTGSGCKAHFYVRNGLIEWA